jgi:hypothetical protein
MISWVTKSNGKSPENPLPFSTSNCSREYPIKVGWGFLTMVYFDNLNNRSSNKYKINLKNRKNLIDIFLYL